MRREPLSARDAAALAAQYGLDAESLSGASILRARKGELLTREDEPMPDLLFLLSGTAKVCTGAANGKTVLLSYFVREGIIGDVELMTGRQTATSTVQAVTPVVCAALPLARYAAALLSDPAFVARAAEEIGRKLIRSSKNMAVTVLHPLDERLCAYIAGAAEDGYFSENRGNLAEQLGTSYRHLLRTLARLCSEGVLSREGDGYRIVDEAALRARAGDFYMLLFP